MRAEGGSQIGASGKLAVSTQGQGSVGAMAQDSQVTLSGAAPGDIQVQTAGLDAHGLVSWASTPGASASLSASNVAVSTTANAAIGAMSLNSGAALTLDNATISTAGEKSFGLGALGGVLNANAVQVSTSGAQADAAGVIDGGTLSVTNGTLSTSGANAAALSAGAPLGATSSARVSNTTLTAAQGPSVRVDEGAADIALNNVTAVQNNGLWLQVGSTDAANPANLNITVDPSTLVGAAVTQAGSTSNVTLADSQWTMTGNSNVTTLNNIRSVIQFSAPAGAVDQLSSYKTLTAVNYQGQGGTLGLNTYLGGDGSPSDRLVVDGGAATGSTSLRISNSGGPGAFTPGNGIQVVSANNGATTEAGAFSLGSRVVGGAYEYQLYRGSADASDPQGWYLRSARPPEPP